MSLFSDHDAFFGDEPSSSSSSSSSSPNAIADAEADAFFSDGVVADAPADQLLARMRAFAMEHAKKTAEMREAMAETLSEAWSEDNDTIAINMMPYDQIPINAMVQTENQQFNKVATVFSYLVVEARQLTEIARAKFYGPLLLFGHKFSSFAFQPEPAPLVSATPATTNNNNPPTRTIEQQFGELLPILQDLSNLQQRVYAVARNILNQLGCLYHERQKLYLSTFKHVLLEHVFEALGALGSICITVDTIVGSNEEIQTGWQMYKRMIKYVRADPAKFGVEVTKLRTFESLLVALDRTVLSASMFEGLLTQEYGLPGGNNNHTLIAGNRILFDQYTNCLRATFKRLSTGLDGVEMAPREQFVELVCSYALYRRVFASTTKPDKKLFNDLWLLQKKVPLIVLFGNALLQIPEFLGRYAAIEAKSVAQPVGKAILTARQEFIIQQDDTFERRTEEYYMQAAIWMVRMDSSFEVSKALPVHTLLLTRTKLVLNGILLATAIHNFVSVNLHMHIRLGVPFRAKNLRSIAVLAELLKAIWRTFIDRQGMIAEHVSLMIGQATFILKHIIGNMRKRIESVKKVDDAKLDALASLLLCQKLLEQPPTAERLAVLSTSLSVGIGAGVFKDEQQLEELKAQLWRVKLLSSWQVTLDRACDCSFLYWSSNLVQVFFEDMFKNPDQVNRLEYLFAAYRDSALLCAGCPPQQRRLFKTELRNEIMAQFTSTIVTPLCREVETDLRLHIHSVVLHQASLRAQQHSRDLTRFISLQPLTFFSQVVDLRERVTHYLDSTFYNLNTVALHDWRVYAEMRNLAYQKYGLVMTEVHLPGLSHYSDSLDVLEIMRNIHIFVARYNYNMNTQLFIERAFDQKHLNTINLYHIADSLRTHGTGIMNTTVNFTYQFLVRKFKIFSEFLYDDHIKSRLIKLLRFFKEKRESLNSRFPYEEADKLSKDIRKLGVSEDGTTFLDQFRRQITEIGNALGYVRLVRSGGLHHCSESIKFVPDLQNIPKFTESVEAEELSAETKQSAKNLDALLEDLRKTFAEGTEYFQLLVDVFTPVLRTDEQKHLRNFYMIVPSLIMNFVDRSLQMKEKLAKTTGKFETTFTDDGFSLGLAYILRVLNDDSAFDSLHWYESVNIYIQAKRDEFQAMSAKKGKKNEEDLQQLAVQVKRLSSVQQEFELFYYSFAGARIFFRQARSSDANKSSSSSSSADSSVSSAPAANGANGTAAVPPAAPPAAPSAAPPTAPPLVMSDNIPMAPPL